MTTAETTISGRLAQVMLESLDAAGNLSAHADLCLIARVPGLDDAELPTEIVISGERRWRLASVEGDFALRVALVEAGESPLLAFTSKGEQAFQADLSERAVLRRTIRPQARHLFSALVGIDAAALDDERFTPPLRDVFAGGRRAALLAAIRKRTWGNVVRESDAIAVLCAAAFGFDDRFAEERPGSLWTSWLIAPPLLSPALTALAIGLLQSSYPPYARLLADAPGGDPEAAFRRVATHTFAGDSQLARLARDTAARLRETDRTRLIELLAPAEAAYIAAGSPDVQAPLLASALAAAGRRISIRCGSPDPPTTDEIDALAAYTFSDAPARESLIRLARLARGLHSLDSVSLPVDLAGFAHAFRDQVAWLDRAARRLREAVFAHGEDGNIRDGLLKRWYELRDRWNAAFAAVLAAEWPTLFAFPGEERPFVVSQILKHIIRPRLANRKTFLVVLDGCDVPTFLELLDAFGAAGTAPVSAETALSAIPTVTGHARRAIFGGDIPGDRISDDDRAADAGADRKAFEGPNAYLGQFSRKLYLKGDLGDGGRALIASLSDRENAPDLIAAVFNDVDDAIASKEHSVLPERTLERCTAAFRDALFAAVEAGWRVVLTADHGHTPYRQPDVKTTTVHPRFSVLEPHAAPPLNTIVFEPGTGMPYRIAALHDIGTHSGPQHLGYHGGVSLEEMFVPLAVFDTAGTTRATILPPAWWDDHVERSPVEVSVIASNGAATVGPVEANVSGADIRVRARAALVGQDRLAAIFERIAEAGSLDASQLASAAGVPVGRLRPFVTGMVNRLREAGIEAPITVEEEPLVFRWTGPR